MTLTLANPSALLLLPLALAPLLKGNETLKVPALGPFGDRRTWASLLLPLRRPLLVTLLGGLILCLADPSLVRTETRAMHQGVDMMLVLDISASMGADDIAPQRIVAARQAAANFIRQRDHDRVGVILFSGLPFLLAPPTLDRQRVAQALLVVEADKRGSGTALGDALAAALARLKNSEAKSKAVILLTDGSSNRGRVSPLSAARQAATDAIRVYTIGIGTTAGGKFHLPAGMRMPPNHPGTGNKAHLAEKQLQDLAALTGGRYYKVSDALGIEAVYSQIDTLEKSPLETLTIRREQPLFEWLAPVLALLLSLEILVFRICLRRVP